MQDDREADVADVLRHVVADPLPTRRGTLQAIDPAVVLLVQDVGRERMQAQAMGILTRTRDRAPGCAAASDPALSGFQLLPLSVLSKTPPSLPEMPM